MQDAAHTQRDIVPPSMQIQQEPQEPSWWQQCSGVTQRAPSSFESWASSMQTTLRPATPLQCLAMLEHESAARRQAACG